MSDDPHPTPSSFPGGEWMLAMFSQLESRITAHSRRMDDGFKDTGVKIDKLGEKMDAHTVDDAVVERRVALIEQARQIEAATVTKRGAMAGTVSGSILIIGYEVLKHLAGWK